MPRTKGAKNKNKTLDKCTSLRLPDHLYNHINRHGNRSEYLRILVEMDYMSYHKEGEK